MSEQEALAGSPPEQGGFEQGAEQPQTETGFVNQSEPGDVNSGGQRQSEAVPYDRFEPVNRQLQEIKSQAREYGYEDPIEFVRALREATEQASGYQQQPESAGYGEEPDTLTAARTRTDSPRSSRRARRTA